MPAITPADTGSTNLCAFLDTIARAEIGTAMLANPCTDNGYRVLVGSMPDRLSLFDDYSDHPMADGRGIEWAPGRYSTAAGRYQILSRYWPHYRDQLGLPDFGPTSQDRYAIQQIREQRALSDVYAGRIEAAIAKCANIWASLPGAGYGQHEHTLDTLIAAYRAADGVLA